MACTNGREGRESDCRGEDGVYGTGRKNLFRSVAGVPSLAGWGPGGTSDLGTMLLEMFAVLVDQASFYGEQVSLRSYLATVSRLTAGQLVALLGYEPRPALSGHTSLALLASVDRLRFRLAELAAAGTGAEQQELQTFEAGAVPDVEIAANELLLPGQVPDTVGEQLILKSDGASVAPGQLVAVVWRDLRGPTPLNNAYRPTYLVDPLPGGALLPPASFDGVFGLGELGFSAGNGVPPVGGGVQAGAARVVRGVREFVGADGQTYVVAEFSDSIIVPVDAKTATMDVLSFSLSAGISPFEPTGTQERIEYEAPDLASGNLGGTTLILDSLYPQISVDDLVVVSVDGRQFLTRVVGAGEGPVRIVEAIPPDTPEVTTRVSAVTVSPALDPIYSERYERVRLHFNSVPVAEPTRVSEDRIASSELQGRDFDVQLTSNTPPDQELDHAGDFLVRDAVGNGALINGRIKAGVSRTLTLEVNEVIAGPEELRLPATIYGNIVPITRGETVTDEVLGSGDPTAPFQEFTLAKSPLTFFADAKAPRGYRSTLTVRVNGIAWTEVPSFYGRGPEEEVYIVRPGDDEGDFKVVFGDGVRGARPPSGVDNITATYRFGAGKDAPAPGAINQLLSPVDGIESVINVFSPTGGADADGPDEIRRAAPRSALTLGRAVSLADFEALALEFGAINAAATWAWDTRSQNAVVKVWFIAEDGPGVADDLRNYLKGFADPTTPIRAERAIDAGKTVVIDLEVDPAYRSDDVEKAVIEALVDPE